MSDVGDLVVLDAEAVALSRATVVAFIKAKRTSERCDWARYVWLKAMRENAWKRVSDAEAKVWR